tara:strand:- start:1824 stop:2084 length:261 start_codon:yes stop_codon:yes gene_type:complete
MSNLMKMTKKQLVDIIECGQDTQFDDFKEELGMPYNTGDEWIGYIKSLQEANREMNEDLKKAVLCMKVIRQQQEEAEKIRLNQGGR